MAVLSNPDTIRAKLDAAPESNPNGKGSHGLALDLDAKLIKLGLKPLTLRAGQTLTGRGSSTCIEFLGGPGTSAIVIDTKLGHKRPSCMGLRNLCVSCPNGANTVATAAGVVVEELLLSDVFLSGGGVRLAGENYMVRFERVRWFDQLGQALFIEGQAHSLHACNVFGGKQGTAPKPTALVEIHGSATLSGFTRIEDSSGAPLLKVTGYAGMEGALFNNGSWIEQHPPASVSVELENARWVGEVVGNVPAHPWKMTNARIFPPGPEGVR